MISVVTSRLSCKQIWFVKRNWKLPMKSRMLWNTTIVHSWKLFLIWLLSTSAWLKNMAWSWNILNQLPWECGLVETVMGIPLWLQIPWNNLLWPSVKSSWTTTMKRFTNFIVSSPSQPVLSMSASKSEKWLVNLRITLSTVKKSFTAVPCLIFNQKSKQQKPIWLKIRKLGLAMKRPMIFIRI